jgi:hypothetical protein
LVEVRDLRCDALVHPMLLHSIEIIVLRNSFVLRNPFVVRYSSSIHSAHSSGPSSEFLRTMISVLWSNIE